MLATATLVGAQAQRPIQIDPRLPRQQGQASRPLNMPSAGPPFTIVEVSAPIQNLFDRADEGIARSDWKFAIDSLQRIIDNPEGSLTLREDATKENEVYESARQRAIKRLAALPAEGISAYRLLYDGRAKGIFERAVSARDSAALRSIVQRYPLTAHADDAAELLASWALDEGRAAEAAALLEGIAVTHSDTDLPAERLHGKLAAAYARMGRIDDANAEVAKITATAGSSESTWSKELVAGIVAYENELGDERTVGNDWPMAGGSPHRNNAMAAVAPALNREAPWSYEQQTVEYSYWARKAEGEEVDSLPLPAAQMVAANGTIFIRTGKGCAALDAEDLSLIWDAPMPEETAVVRASLRREMGRIIRDKGELPGRATDDEVGGSLAVAHGLVFTIENHGNSGNASGLGEAVMLPRFGFGMQNVPLRSTRLVARDMVGGELKWSRGRSAEATDPLSLVDFRGMPIPVGPELWVPFTSQNDLMIGVLDPRDGVLKQSIALCSVGNPLASTDRTLYLTHTEGMVYLASGHGVVFALDAADMTPVWASANIETHRSGPRRVVAEADDGMPRLSSAPVVAGGLLLVAPPDRTELFAFDRITGEIRWTLSLDADSYIVGARKDRFWLGGRELTCHQAIDRKVLWRKKLTEPATGRAILAGDRLFVPTLVGVTTLEAASGETLAAQPLPYPATPLGQLLSLNHSMYSFDSLGVRRFVDLERLYPEAVAIYEASPQDWTAAVRLARLELLRGDAQRARTTLRHIDLAALPDDHAKSAVSKTLVRALLALALDEKVDAKTAIAVLDEAAAVAWDAHDRMSCVFAKADYLISDNKLAEAASVIWNAALHPDATAMRAIGSAVTGQSRIALAARLEQILAKSDAAAVSALAELVRKSLGDSEQMLNSSNAPSGMQRFRSIADLPSVEGSMELALLKLAQVQAQRGQVEAAEQSLLECKRRTKAREFAAAATMQLVDLRMALPFEPTPTIVPLLDELEREYAQAIVPAAAYSFAKQSGVIPWVTEKRQALTSVISEILPLSPPGSFRVLDPTPAWIWQPNAAARSPQVMTQPKRLPRIVRFADPAEGVLGDRLVVFDDAEESMMAVSIRDRTALWEAPLRRPGTFRDDNAPWKDSVITGLRRAGFEGQTAVMCGHEGIFAVGMLTGKRLWLRPYETMTPFGHLGVREVTTAVGAGVLASMPRAGKLTAIRLSDGETLWERDVRAEPVTYVRFLGGAIATLDDWLERVTLLSREDGRLIKQLRFRQPDPKRLLVGLVQTGGVLCGPDRAEGGVDEVVGYSVRTGEQQWRVALDKPVAGFFEPGEGYLGVALLGGEVRILRAADGEPVMSRVISGVQAISEGLLVDGIFLARHYSQVGGPRYSELIALDVATGELLWRRGEVRALAGMTDDLRVQGGQLVAVIDYTPAGSKVKRVGLSVIDIRTGLSMGPTLDLPQVDQRVHFDGEVVVWSTAVVVQLQNGLYGFALKPMEAGAGG